MVVIPKGLLIRFHLCKTENQKPLTWSDDDMPEPDGEKFEQNTLEHLCANMYLALEAVITSIGAEHTTQFMKTARAQLKSFGVDVDTAKEECYATPSDDELVELHNFYSLTV